MELVYNFKKIVVPILRVKETETGSDEKEIIEFLGTGFFKYLS